MKVAVHSLFPILNLKKEKKKNKLKNLSFFPLFCKRGIWITLAMYTFVASESNQSKGKQNKRRKSRTT